MRILIVLVLLITTHVESHAASAHFDFSGQLLTNTSTGQTISGEFSGYLEYDLGMMDLISNPSIGQYSGLLVSGEVDFNGLALTYLPNGNITIAVVNDGYNGTLDEVTFVATLQSPTGLTYLLTLIFSDSTLTAVADDSLLTSFDLSDYDEFDPDQDEITPLAYFQVVSHPTSTTFGTVTEAQISLVPLPLSIWFMLSGLACLAGFRGTEI